MSVYCLTWLNMQHVELGSSDGNELLMYVETDKTYFLEVLSWPVQTQPSVISNPTITTDCYSTF